MSRREEISNDVLRLVEEWRTNNDQGNRLHSDELGLSALTTILLHLGSGDLTVSIVMEASRYLQTGDRKPLEDLLAKIPDSEESPWNLTT